MRRVSSSRAVRESFVEKTFKHAREMPSPTRLWLPCPSLSLPLLLLFLLPSASAQSISTLLVQPTLVPAFSEPDKDQVCYRDSACSNVSTALTTGPIPATDSCYARQIRGDFRSNSVVGKYSGALFNYSNVRYCAANNRRTLATPTKGQSGG